MTPPSPLNRSFPGEAGWAVTAPGDPASEGAWHPQGQSGAEEPKRAQQAQAQACPGAGPGPSGAPPGPRRRKNTCLQTCRPEDGALPDPSDRPASGIDARMGRNRVRNAGRWSGAREPGGRWNNGWTPVREKPKQTGAEGDVDNCWSARHCLPARCFNQGRD